RYKVSGERRNKLKRDSSNRSVFTSVPSRSTTSGGARMDSLGSNALRCLKAAVESSAFMTLLGAVGYAIMPRSSATDLTQALQRPIPCGGKVLQCETF